MICEPRNPPGIAKAVVRLLVAGTLLPTVLGLTSAAVAQADDARGGHALVQAMEKVFERSQSEDLKEYGLANSTYAANAYNTCLQGAWLKTGEPMISTAVFNAGVEYAVIGGGDASAVEMHLKIVDAKGKSMATLDDPVVTENTQEGNRPAVVFTPPKTARYGIVFSVDKVAEDAGGDSAYGVYVILRKNGGWDVPLENLKAAAASLSKRVNLVNAAVGGADFAYGTFSLMGMVLPKGGLCATSYGPALKATNEHVVTAASDGNAESLEVAIGSLFRGATKNGEVDDEGAKVTFARSSATRELGVKNTKGAPSLILVAITQVVKAG